MKISVLGLGYVGTVTAGCLARRGHTVIGVDVHPQKVAEFNEGKAPIIEPGLDKMLSQAHEAGRLRATQHCAEAVAQSEVSIVCVGTPSTISGTLDLSYVRQVTREVAVALRTNSQHQVLIYRSTMLPGSTQALVEEWLADLVQEGRLEVLYYPEFLREGSAVKDFETPSLTVVGTREGTSLPPQGALLFGDGVRVASWRIAEMLKYACNAFHATKVAFANEIGRLGRQMEIDAVEVMNLLCQDTRLNISAYYLRPGNPFGGSCLPKDVRALAHFSRQQGLRLPLLENLLPSNEQHLQSLLQQIENTGQHEVILLGLSFKANTDDLRESPMVEVAQHLLGRGYHVRIYDPQLNLAVLVGSNKRLIDTRMPHLASLLRPDLASALGSRGLVVVTQPCVTVAELSQCLTSHHRILDVNGWPELKSLPCPYEGSCW
jgi:GDP-mannose 6-dehydrogenase